MLRIKLNNKQKSRVLAHLGVAEAAATLPFLERLIAAYCRTVPWESAFRIVRRAETAVTTNCPRWPEKFWQDALKHGGGGTCFESNYAFFALLQSLGFDGYLTINNMGESIGCHTAIIIVLDGQKWLVDAGLPIYVPLPISSRGVMRRSSLFLHYTVRPNGRSCYQIDQHPHPKQIAFTLIDEPVDDASYRAATAADYGEDGHFLEAVIVNKIINNQSWRFNMTERPWRLNRFDWGKRFDIELEGDPATAVARHFGMETAVVQQAFGLTDKL
ncbi:MAG: arylamine N-acetyltransferase, partial [Chloroflexi bacterium]|nr:arylamine N-acetyltransferase [Chloroflexota bacterium]